MLLTINIGLATGNGDTVGAGEAAHELETLGTIVGLNLKHVKHDKGGEPTLIVDLAVTGRDIEAIRQRVNNIAVQLRQDCIAVWFHAENGHGELIGEKAASWGTFNPIYFHFIGA